MSSLPSFFTVFGSFLAVFLLYLVCRAWVCPRLDTDVLGDADFDPVAAEGRSLSIGAVEAVEQRHVRLQTSVDRLKRTLRKSERRLAHSTAARESLLARLHAEVDDAPEMKTERGSRRQADADRKGRALYGEAWDRGVDGGLPLRLIFSLAPDEVEQLQQLAVQKLMEEGRPVPSSLQHLLRQVRLAADGALSEEDSDDSDETGFLLRPPTERASEAVARAERLRAAVADRVPRLKLEKLGIGGAAGGSRRQSAASSPSIAATAARAAAGKIGRLSSWWKDKRARRAASTATAPASWLDIEAAEHSGSDADSEDDEEAAEEEEEEEMEEREGDMMHHWKHDTAVTATHADDVAVGRAAAAAVAASHRRAEFSLDSKRSRAATRKHSRIVAVEGGALALGRRLPGAVADSGGGDDGGGRSSRVAPVPTSIITVSSGRKVD